MCQLLKQLTCKFEIWLWQKVQKLVPDHSSAARGSGADTSRGWTLRHVARAGGRGVTNVIVRLLQVGNDCADRAEIVYRLTI